MNVQERELERLFSVGASLRESCASAILCGRVQGCGYGCSALMRVASNSGLDGALAGNPAVRNTEDRGRQSCRQGDLSPERGGRAISFARACRLPQPYLR